MVCLVASHRLVLLFALRSINARKQWAPSLQFLIRLGHVDRRLSKENIKRGTIHLSMSCGEFAENFRYNGFVKESSQTQWFPLFPVKSDPERSPLKKQTPKWGGVPLGLPLKQQKHRYPQAQKQLPNGPILEGAGLVAT